MRAPKAQKRKNRNKIQRMSSDIQTPGSEEFLNDRLMMSWKKELGSKRDSCRFGEIISKRL